MKAMQLRRLGILQESSEPLDRTELSDPSPEAGDVLIRVTVCGVCHTELDEIEGRLRPPRLPVVPGHEVVGQVVELGAGVTSHVVGDRVGVGRIHSSTGEADEDLSPEFVATGCDVDGG